MVKKQITIFIMLSLLMFSVYGCEKKDKELTNDSKSSVTEYIQEQDTNVSIKETNDYNTAEEIVTTEESIEQLMLESKEQPLQFGDVVTMSTYYYPNPDVYYAIEADITITDYENTKISCDVKLVNKTPIGQSSGAQDIYFDGNFVTMTLYDENFKALDYAQPILALEGGTQGESNKLNQDQVLKGEIGPLKGAYEGVVPKYIGFTYACEYTDYSVIPYEVFYEIPDGLFDTSYVYVDMSQLGANTAEEALELCLDAIINNDANIAKKISLFYYMCYEKTGRVLLDEWECGDYLFYGNTEKIVSSVTQEPIDIRTLSLMGLEAWENEMSPYGGVGVLQAGYVYSYYYLETTRIGCSIDIYLLMCDNRWFAVLDYQSND